MELSTYIWKVLVLLTMMFYCGYISYHAFFKKSINHHARNETKCWYLGVFYCNLDDNRVAIPKQNGKGFALNFAKPVVIAFIGTIVSLILIDILI